MYEIINLNLNAGDEKILLAKVQQILNHTRYMSRFVTAMYDHYYYNGPDDYGKAPDNRHD